MRKKSIIQYLTISRAICGLLFICISLEKRYYYLTIIVYLYASLTDILDGYLARKFNCTSKMGGVLDLFSDKFFTIISLTYLIAKSYPILPCAFAIFREALLLTLRNAHIEIAILFPTQRIFGGIITFLIWFGTFFELIFSDDKIFNRNCFDAYLWLIGCICFINTFFRIKKKWKYILKAFEE